MLDTDTKRRIDTARDILVGKVPDPKSQVEQITIALIYKFMDDMDAEAVELGGKRKFFTKEFARYGWAKLMGSGLGGHELLALYAEGITKMPENPGIPPLFRDIFKNAYLPYRDPETLKAFLKIINEFTYDHSERLGDAFEYLLSVLGSQGDAGQFRTPRHIIDFIVSIVDPKKNETVLDPACGTAGFLISSYKHILKANSRPSVSGTGSPTASVNTLTPDDRGRLAKNFKGYDISPDMVRLSLVNLYLHGFTDPHIYEYDTLTSEERWNEFADVILANPPFMSPKGGIKPHKRFSIQAKRSEVLFVDYMAEHLTPTGRAGIIVPEGIIFQSQDAYKSLRKMLVENSLVAVISLPAGCFNPYSGVKTSILILDKALAKKATGVAFFKVENDGFGLGAQRRAFDKNDLPQVEAELAAYIQSLRTGTRIPFEMATGLIVPKEKIAANGDYNLSGERYREGTISTSNYPLVPLSQVARVKNGFAFKSEEYVKEGIRVIRIKNVQKGEVIDDDPKFVSSERLNEFADFALEVDDILMSLTGNVGRVGRLKKEQEPAVLNQRVAHIQPIDTSLCVPEFLFALLNTDKFESDATAGSGGVAQANLSSRWVSDYEIPLPPLELQKEIVAEIEGYQKVINGARAVLDHYRPHIPIHPDWPMVDVGDLCDMIQYGLSVPLKVEGKGFKTFRMNELVEGKCVDRGDMKCADISGEEFEKYRLKRGDILFNRTNSFEHVGRTGIFDLDGEYCFASYLIRLSIKKGKADPFYVNAFMNSDSFQQGIKKFASRAIGQSNINATNLAAYPIPLPPLAAQQAIVAEIEAEQALVAANRELITRFEKKIQATLARIWGEETPANGKVVPMPEELMAVAEDPTPYRVSAEKPKRIASK
jgi:type I restriction enzyme M protein